MDYRQAGIRTGTNFIMTFEDLQNPLIYAGNPGRRYFPAADSVKGCRGALQIKMPGAL